MIAISRKSGYAIGLCRSALEIFAASFGYILGGLLGLGTIIAAIALGFMIQLVFTLFNFDPRQIKHESLKETLLRLKK